MEIKTARAEMSPVRQTTQYNCMSASMSMCLIALGLPIEEASMALVNKVMGARPMKGAAWEDALACAQHFGCRAMLTVPATVAQLKSWTDAGKPVMIAWNPEGRDWSHASAVYNVTDGPPQFNEGQRPGLQRDGVVNDPTCQVIGSGPGMYVWVADPNIPNPNKTTRIVHEDEFYSRWYEKWPNYLVRRPACVLDREITADGRQVVASGLRPAFRVAASHVQDWMRLAPGADPRDLEQLEKAARSGPGVSRTPQKTLTDVAYDEGYWGRGVSGWMFLLGKVLRVNVTREYKDGSKAGRADGTRRATDAARVATRFFAAGRREDEWFDKMVGFADKPGHPLRRYIEQHVEVRQATVGVLKLTVRKYMSDGWKATLSAYDPTASEQALYDQWFDAWLRLKNAKAKLREITRGRKWTEKGRSRQEIQEGRERAFGHARPEAGAASRDLKALEAELTGLGLPIPEGTHATSGVPIIGGVVRLPTDAAPLGDWGDWVGPKISGGSIRSSYYFSNMSDGRVESATLTPASYTRYGFPLSDKPNRTVIRLFRRNAKRDIEFVEFLAVDQVPPPADWIRGRGEFKSWAFVQTGLYDPESNRASGVQTVLSSTVKERSEGLTPPPEPAPASTAPASSGDGRQTFDRRRTQAMVAILDTLIAKTGMGMFKGFKKDLKSGKGLTEKQLKAVRHNLYKIRMRSEADQFRMTANVSMVADRFLSGAL